MRNLRNEVRRILHEEFGNTKINRMYINEDENVNLITKLLNPGKFKLTKNDLIVNGDLDLGYTKIRLLPKGLKVYGNLNLYGTPITSLPDGLFVTGWVDVVNTKIKDVPHGLKVGDDFSYGNTPLDKYPESVVQAKIEEKGGYVKGNVIDGNPWRKR